MRFTARRLSSPRAQNSPGAVTARHGSDERDVFGRQVAWSSITPPHPTGSPRSPSPRNQEEDDDDPRRSERAERREQRSSNRDGRAAGPTEPVGLNFRLQAVETTLRDHTNELAAQKLMMNQLVEVVKQDALDNKEMKNRLEVSFTQSNQKHADQDKETDLLKQRVEFIMSTVNAMTATVVQRLDQLSAEVDGWRRNAPQGGASPPTRQMPPPTPQSWTGPAAAPMSGQPMSGQPMSGQPMSGQPMSGQAPTTGFGNGAFTLTTGGPQPTSSMSGNSQVPIQSGPNNFLLTMENNL